MLRGESKLPTIVGLVLALLGPPLVAFAFRKVSPGVLPWNFAAQCCLVCVALAVVLIVRWGERRGLSTVGVRAPRLDSLAWAVLLTVANIFVVAPMMQATMSLLGSHGFAATVREIARLPVWYRVAIIVVDATIEELLYRGYALDRLAVVLRSQAAAVVLSSAIFAYAHAPLWGVGVATALLLPALLAGTFYLWRRDLSTMIAAHIATDLVGLVFTR
jgi:membrane protease YdiL (CAAX protease family)